ncbi:hypothetical protein DR093_03275, partial [Mycoplasma flocculare]|nr:hypothetical protein [Mesomycoplasma flocculare]
PHHCGDHELDRARPQGKADGARGDRAPPWSGTVGCLHPFRHGRRGRENRVHRWIRQDHQATRASCAGQGLLGRSRHH